MKELLKELIFNCFFGRVVPTSSSESVGMINKISRPFRLGLRHLVAAFTLVLIFFSLTANLSSSNPIQLFPWWGQVIEKDTGRPIEGTVIVVSWERRWPTPAGTASELFAVREALSDKEGKFSIPGRPVSVSVPVIYEIEERRAIVFKPGYKFLILEKRPPKITMEKVPTLLEVRKREVEQAYGNHETDVHATQVFKDRVLREQEFVQCEHRIEPLRASYFRRSDARKEKDLPLMRGEPRARDPETVERLIDELNDEDPVIRRKAAEGLGKREIRYPDHINALRKLIQSKLRSTQEKTIDLENLARIGAPLVPILFEEAKRDSKVRDKVICIIRMIQDPDAVPLLIPYLEGDDPSARYIASFALIHFRDPRTIKPWIKVLPDKDVQYHAVQSLIRIGTSAGGPLIEALKEGNPETRKQAAYILGFLGVEEALVPLIGLAKDKEPEVRRSVAYALGGIRDAGAVETLIALLNDKDSEVQRLTAEALSKIQDRRAIGPLIETLKDPSFKATIHSVEALASMPDQRVAEALINTWKDLHQQVRSRAADVLLFVGRPAVDPLCGALRNPDSYYRWRAAWVLGKINDPGAVDHLIPLLRDDVSEVKWAAAGALGLITEPFARAKAVSALVTMFDDEDHGISKRISDSLRRLGYRMKNPTD